MSEERLSHQPKEPLVNPPPQDTLRRIGDGVRIAFGLIDDLNKHTKSLRDREDVIKPSALEKIVFGTHRDLERDISATRRALELKDDAIGSLFHRVVVVFGRGKTPAGMLQLRQRTSQVLRPEFQADLLATLDNQKEPKDLSAGPLDIPPTSANGLLSLDEAAWRLAISFYAQKRNPDEINTDYVAKTIAGVLPDIRACMISNTDPSKLRSEPHAPHSADNPELLRISDFLNFAIWNVLPGRSERGRIKRFRDELQFDRPADFFREDPLREYRATGQSVVEGLRRRFIERDLGR